METAGKHELTTDQSAASTYQGSGSSGKWQDDNNKEIIRLEYTK